MPTSRTWPSLFKGAALVLAAIACPGCAADADEGDGDVAEQEGAIGASPTAAGIQSGSLEEEGVMLLANDRAMTVDLFRQRTRLSATAAKSIVASRADAEGKPRWLANIDELDALAGTTNAAFKRLVSDARANGYIEAPGFDAPTLARLSVPDNLGRPPTANDVTVEAGFDGKTPDEARAIVRARLTNTVHESNERFVDQTIASTHKAFTIALGNFFAQNSPHAAFARSLRVLGATSFTLLGTMSALRPTILLVDAGGTKTYWARGASGRYERIETPSYPVIMRSHVRIDGEGPGVRLFYPAWSARVLTGPTTVIIEGGPG